MTPTMQVLARSKGLASADIKKLGDVQTALGSDVDDLVEVVKDTLHTEPYTKQEVCDIMGVSVESLEENTLSARSRAGL